MRQGRHRRPDRKAYLRKNVMEDEVRRRVLARRCRYRDCDDALQDSPG